MSGREEVEKRRARAIIGEQRVPRKKWRMSQSHQLLPIEFSAGERLQSRGKRDVLSDFDYLLISIEKDKICLSQQCSVLGLGEIVFFLFLYPKTLC